MKTLKKLLAGGLTAALLLAALTACGAKDTTDTKKDDTSAPAAAAQTAAKDDAVWPEGKDASPGAGIRSSTAGFTAKGRALPIHGFSHRLHSSRSSTRAQARQVPAFRVFGITSSAAASRIQTSP